MSIIYDIDGNPRGFEAAMARAADAAQRGANRIGDQMASVKGVLDRVTGSFGLMAGAIAGVFSVDKVIDFVNETYRLNDAAEDLAAKLGTGATQAGLLTTRLQLADVESETYTSSLMALQKQLAKNEDGLQAMGVKTRDASGALLDQQQLMDNAIGVMSQYKSGTDRTQAAMVLFGKSASEAEQLLKLLNVSQEEAREFAEALNLTLTEESQAAASAYEAALERAGQGVKGIKNAIGTAFMPVLTDMLEAFNFLAPAAVKVFRGALGGLTTTFLAIELGARTMVEVALGALYIVVEPIRGLIEATALAVQGRFSDAAAAMNRSFDNVGVNSDAVFDRIGDSARRMREQVATIFGTGTATAATPLDGDKTYQGEGRDKKGDPSQMPQFEAALAARKLAFQQAQQAQGTFLEFGKQAEADYWRKIAALADIGASDRAAAVKKAIDLELAIYKEAGQQKLADLREELQGAHNSAELRLEIAQRNSAETRRLYGEDSQAYRAARRDELEAERALSAQRLQMAQVEIDARQFMAENELSFERDMLERALDTNLIGRGQYLAQLRRLEQQQYQIALEGLEARKALIDPALDPVAFAQISAQIEALQRAHVLRMAGIVQQGTLPANRDFQNMMGNLEQSWSRGLNSMLQGTLGWRQALRGLWQGVYQEFVQQMIAAPVARWLAKEATLTVATLVGSQQRLAIEETAAAESLAVSAGVALKEIAMRAWTAIAGAYNALVGIPYVGPFIAPVAAAGAGAFVFGLAKNIASAENGYDIPAGVNPMTQLHAKEMVLPAKYADVVRSMADERGGGRRGGGDTFVIQAVDARSVRRLLEQNGTAVADALRMQARNFNSRTSTR